MTKMCTCLLNACMLIVFHVHVPVTMFPATHVTPDRPTHGVEDVVEYMKPSWDSGWGTNKSMDSFYSTVKTSLARSRLNTNIADELEPIIGSSMDVLSHLNVERSEPKTSGHAAFSNRKYLNVIYSALSTNHIKSLHVNIKRITQDLIKSKSKRISTKSANISANPSKHRLVLPSHQENIDQDEGTHHTNKPGITTAHTSLTADEINTQTHQKNDIKDTKQVVTELNNNAKHNYTSGIMWSSRLNDICAKGFTNKDHSSWKQKLEDAAVIHMEEGCGNMQNRLVTFSDSTQACVRFRQNTDLMQGDIYSYYLSKLLDMDYIPPTTLHKPDPTQQWAAVSADMDNVKWPEHRAIIMTKWIRDLTPVYIPSELKGPDSLLHPHNALFNEKTLPELCTLVQWTDLIVFDYISANLDRVVNNMFSLKWNDKMMERPIHNLETTHSSDRLMFLDNESGLFHGYRLLDTYGPFHKSLLDSVCVFTQSTVDAVERLYKAGNAGDELQALYQDNEPLHGHLPRMPQKNKETLKHRIEDVYKHMQLCKHRYSGS